MELLPTDQPKDSGTDSSDSSEDEIFSLSHCASVSVQGKKTIKLHALVNNQELLVLIDSGSSSTFIVTRLLTRSIVQSVKLHQFKLQ